MEIYYIKLFFIGILSIIACLELINFIPELIKKIKNNKNVK